MKVAWLIVLSFFICTDVLAEDVYQQPKDFIKETFNGATPSKKSLNPNKKQQKIINKIMSRTYYSPKVEYWEKDGRTAWILEEIGKVKPITTGFVINGDKIERMKVLIYRESHGWQVKHDFFTDQFKDLGLKSSYKLTGYIDNISGATMSVDALRNLGELALYLHQERNN